MGLALGEEGRAVEPEQAFLDDAAHDVGHVGCVRAVPESALEAVGVQQRHEELEVLLLAVVGRGGHEKEVASQARQQLPQLVALGELDLSAEVGGRHLVGLVAHHQVPAAIRRLELLLHVLVAGQLVQARDDQVRLYEPVAGACRLQLVVGEELEGEVEAVAELVLPLFRQCARTHHQATLQVAARDELLHEQARHDRLSGARIVGQEEAQGLSWQHLPVHRRDLVRQRLDPRRVDGQHGVEEVRQPNAEGLRDEPEEGAVSVEAPRPALLDDLQAGLVVPVEQLVGDFTFGGPVGQLQCFGPEPLDADDGGHAVRERPAHLGAGGEVFQAHERGLGWGFDGGGKGM